MQNKTILIVDDTVSNLDILIELLEEYDVIDTTKGSDALDIVRNEKIDLVLLDIMMPEMDGYEVCKRLKSDPITKDIPVIFITAKTDEESIEKAYNVGGADYVTKPFKPKELLSRVNKELRLQDLMNELRLSALTDSMTKLYNRRYFAEVSEHYINLAKRENRSIFVIMLDIDKFKNINDTYGHDIGDKVIILLADILRKNIRKSDVACRYGGEEFAILLPESSKEGAMKVAQTIRKNCEAVKISLNSDQFVHFSISLGVAEVDPSQNRAIEVALKHADEALYKAKESGRNKVEIFLAETKA